MESPLNTFVVERKLPGIKEELLMEVHRLLREAARRVSSAGDAVRYVRCTYIREENRCICVFEASTLTSVQRVNEIAQVPFRHISSAIEFWAPGGVSTGAGTTSSPHERRRDEHARRE